MSSATLRNLQLGDGDQLTSGNAGQNYTAHDYDSIDGGAGNDTIVLQVQRPGDPKLPRYVNGGAGFDTLELKVGVTSTQQGMFQSVFTELPQNVRGIEKILLSAEDVLGGVLNRLEVNLADWRAHFGAGQVIEISGQDPARFTAAVAFTDPWNWNEITRASDQGYRVFTSVGNDPFTLRIARDVYLQSFVKMPAHEVPSEPWYSRFDADYIYLTAAPPGTRGPILEINTSIGDDNIYVESSGYDSTYIVSGDGNDWVYCASRNPYVIGGMGNDNILVSAPGHATLYGDGGDDSISIVCSGASTFNINGGAGNDRLKFLSLLPSSTIADTLGSRRYALDGGAGLDTLSLVSNGDFGDLFALMDLKNTEILDLLGYATPSEGPNVKITLDAATLEDNQVSQLFVRASNLQANAASFSRQVELRGFTRDLLAEDNGDGLKHYVRSDAQASAIRLSIDMVIHVIGVANEEAPIQVVSG